MSVVGWDMIKKIKKKLRNKMMPDTPFVLSIKKENEYFSYVNNMR